MKNPSKSIPAKDTWEAWRKRRNQADFNVLAHDILHTPRTLVWTSPTTLVTAAGSRLYPKRGGTLISATANVQAAPTSALTWTVLKNGTAIFGTAPTISNESGAYPVFDDETEWIDNPIFVRGDYFQFQVSVIGGATGPFVGVLEYMPEEVF